MEVKAQEGGHFYDSEGNPCYTVIAKNGNPRPSTLADCRKNNWYPSTTTILGVVAKPGLEAWKIKQAIMSALTLPRLPDESEDDFLVRVEADYKEQGKKAMQKGTDIHASLERAYGGDLYSPEHEVYVASVKKAILDYFGEQKWIAEKSFAHPLGFGGKIDSASLDDETASGIVLDYKTTEFSEEQAKKGKVGGYSDQCMQLCAYSAGLGIQIPRLANVYVSTNNPGLVHILEWSSEDIQKGWEMFTCLLRYWQLEKGYKPNV